MNRKYAVITGFLSKLQDRFIDYQPPRKIEEIVEIASRIKGCSGLEVVYPQNFNDPVKLKKLLENYGLSTSAVNLNVKSEKKFLFGSFSNPDAEIRKEAIKYMKDAMDCAAELDCNLVQSAFLNDGSDYPFEIDYLEAFNNTVEGIKEAAKYRPDVKISLEYKSSEPRVHCLLNNAGKIAYLCNIVAEKNVGVTLDTGHAFQSLEVPADTVAFLGCTGKLFHVHINDNNRNWDWDLVPGTINFWDFLEFIIYLNKVEYHGWMTADVFPQRHDPIKIMEKTFEWMDYMISITEKINEGKLFEMMHERDAFDVLDYIKTFV